MAKTKTGLNEAQQPKQTDLVNTSIPTPNNNIAFDPSNVLNVKPKIEVVDPLKPKTISGGISAQTQTQPTALTNTQGNLSGVTLPDSRTFLGLGPDDVNKILNREQEKKFPSVGGAGGAMMQSDVAAQNQMMRQQGEAAQAAMAQLGLTPEQMQRQVVSGEGVAGGIAAGAAGLTGALGGVGTAAGIGAALGSTVPVAGTIAGAVVGAVIGAYTKISISKKQDVKEAFTNYNAAKSNLDWIINNVNNGVLSPQQAVELWDDNLATIYAAQRALKKETSTSLKRFLSGGSDEMAKIDAYVQRLPFNQALLVQALQTPNPSKIIQSLDIENIQ